MLKSIRDYFERNIGTQAPAQTQWHSIELATAALLVEVLRSDAQKNSAEEVAVLRAVRAKFGLSAEEAGRWCGWPRMRCGRRTITTSSRR